MPMTEVYGDILTIPAKTRVCTINMVSAAGAGVAKEFRNRVPGWYKHYLKMVKTIMPSQFIVYNYQNEIHLMVPTKIDWREDSPRDLVIMNLGKLARITRDDPRFGTIVLPPFGCGNGHLNYYSDIRNIYLRLFEDHPRDFVVVLGKHPS